MADTGKLKFYNDFFSTETNPEILIVDTNMDTIDNNDNRMSLREAIITTQASDKKDWEIRFITREQDENYVEQSPQLGLGYWAIKLQKPLPTIAKNNIAINYYKSRRITLIPGSVAKGDETKDLKKQAFIYPIKGKGGTNGSMLNIGETDLSKSGNIFLSESEKQALFKDDGEGGFIPIDLKPFEKINYPKVAINNFNFLKNTAKGGDGTNGGGGGLGSGGAISLFSGDLSIENSLFQGLSAEGGKGAALTTSQSHGVGESGGNGGLFSGGFGTPGQGGSGGKQSEWAGWCERENTFYEKCYPHANTFKGNDGSAGTFGSGGGAGGGGGGGYLNPYKGFTAAGSGGNGGMGIGGGGSGTGGKAGFGNEDMTDDWGQNNQSGMPGKIRTIGNLVGFKANNTRGGNGKAVGGAITIYSTNVNGGAPVKWLEERNDQLGNLSRLDENKSKYIPIFANAELKLSDVDFRDNRIKAYDDDAIIARSEHIFSVNTSGNEKKSGPDSDVQIQHQNNNKLVYFDGVEIDDVTITCGNNFAITHSGKCNGAIANSVNNGYALSILNLTKKKSPFNFALSTEKNTSIANTRSQVIKHVVGTPDITTIEYELPHSGPATITSDSSALTASIGDLWRKQYPDKEAEILEKYSLKNMAINYGGNLAGIGSGLYDITVIGNVVKTTKFGVALKVLQNTAGLIGGIISSNTKKKEELAENQENQRKLNDRLSKDLSIDISSVRTTKERDVITIEDFTIGEDTIILPNVNGGKNKIAFSKSATVNEKGLVKSVDLKYNSVKTEDSLPATFLSISLSEDSVDALKSTNNDIENYLYELVALKELKEGDKTSNQLIIGTYANEGKVKKQSSGLYASGPASTVIKYDRESGGSSDTDYWSTTTHSGDDQVYGSDYRERIFTGRGDDIIMPGLTVQGDSSTNKNEVIDGQDGRDMVSYSDTPPVLVSVDSNNPYRLYVKNISTNSETPIDTNLRNIEIIQVAAGSNVDLSEAKMAASTASSISNFDGYVVRSDAGSTINGSMKSDDFYISFLNNDDYTAKSTAQSIVNGNIGLDNLTIYYNPYKSGDEPTVPLELKKDDFNAGAGSVIIQKNGTETELIKYTGLETIVLVASSQTDNVEPSIIVHEVLNNSGSSFDIDGEDDEQVLREDLNAPTLVEGEVSDTDQIRLYFDEELKDNNPAASLFKVLVDNKRKKVSSTSMSADQRQLILNMNKAIIGDNVILSYKDFSKNQSRKTVQDISGNKLWALRNIPMGTLDDFVVNYDRPLINDSLFSNKQIMLSFSEVLAAGSIQTNRFKVKVDGKRYKVSSIEVLEEDAILQLNLRKKIKADSDVRISYTAAKKDRKKGVIQDYAGNDVETFLDYKVEHPVNPDESLPGLVTWNPVLEGAEDMMSL
ncbi:MAG: SwmB domain-containing protein [Prochlorococcus sp.]